MLSTGSNRYEFPNILLLLVSIVRRYQIHNDCQAVTVSNPTIGHLNFSLKEHYSSIKIEVYDLKGQLVQEDNFTNSSDVLVDISDEIMSD